MEHSGVELLKMLMEKYPRNYSQVLNSKINNEKYSKLKQSLLAINARSFSESIWLFLNGFSKTLVCEICNHNPQQFSNAVSGYRNSQCKACHYEQRKTPNANGISDFSKHAYKLAAARKIPDINGITNFQKKCIENDQYQNYDYK